MLKKQMENLMAGQVVLDTRNNVELEIVGVGETKVILINGKEYSKSTLKRYFKLVEQQIPEVVEPDNTILDDIEQADELTSEQDTTADTEETEVQVKFNLGDKVVTNFGVGEVVSVPHLVELDGKVTMSNYRVAIVEDGQRYLFDYKEEQLEAYTDTTTQDTEEQTNTSDLKDTNTQGNEVHEDTDTAVKKDIVEPTIQQSNLIQSLNNLIDLHNVRLEPKREYIKVSMEGKRGALCMIRNSRYGSLHIDMKSKVFAQLTEEYRDLLIEQYDCKVYDSSRGYYRVFNWNDIVVLRTIILTAKQVG